MCDYYNKLSEEYDKLYLDNIIRFQEQMIIANKKERHYVDFYPSFGVKKPDKVEFLIYGQAVNGWDSGFNLHDEIDNDKLKQSINASNCYPASTNFNPIDWVNLLWSDSIYNKYCTDQHLKEFYNLSYRTNRSFFWNVTYKLICDYYGISRDSFGWSGNLVWSNLYKIAPDGANPDEQEKRLQLPLATDLVKWELQEINPKYCILLTNLEWWKPFRKNIGTEIIGYDKPLDEVESVERYRGTMIIVMNRPRVGNSEKFAGQILRIIQTPV